MKWTDEEKKILIDNYEKMGHTVTTLLTNRTKQACIGKAYELKLRTTYNGSQKKLVRWSKEEVDILKKYYESEGISIHTRLPNRGIHSIRNKASKLGLYSRRADDNIYNKLNIWTTNEIDILVKNYPIMGNMVHKMLPRHTITSIKQKVTELGIKYRLNKWTNEEIETLKKYYPTEGYLVYKRFNNKTISSCNDKARKLKLKCKLCKTRARWTDEELYILRKYYPTEGCKVNEMIPNRNYQCIRNKANQLGIKFIGYGYFEVNEDDWTTSDINKLKKYYKLEGVACFSKFENHTVEECQLMINKIRSLRFWTKEEVSILTEYYPIEGSKVLDRLPYKNYYSIVSKANRLGIKYSRNN